MSLCQAPLIARVTGDACPQEFGVWYRVGHPYGPWMASFGPCKFLMIK